MAGNEQEYGQDNPEVEHRLIELQYVLQQYENRYNYISEELSSAQASLKSIEEAQKAAQGSFSGRNLLVNIGGGLFAKAKAADFNPLLINIGAGILIEVAPTAAYELLGKKRSIAEQNVSKLSDEHTKIEHEIYSVSFMIQQLTNGQNV